MAIQAFNTGNALAPEQWSEGLEAEVLKKISYRAFIGKRSDALVQEKDELSKRPGDTVNFGVRAQLDETSAPIQGNAGLEGNEMTLDLFDDSLVINQIRHAIRFYNVIDRQRVNFEMRDEAKAGLSDYFAGVMDAAFFHQIAGNVAVTATARTGNNATVAPSDFIRPTGSTDEGLGSGNTFTLDLVDKAVEKAKTRSPFPLRPAYIDGLGTYYVMFLHPYQVTALRSSSSQWYTLQRDILQSTKDPDGNPLITGALGVYNGTLLVESSRVPTGANSSTSAAISTVRRSIFAGAQAAGIAYGRYGGTDERFRWVEEEFDYKNEVGIGAGMIVGLKKLRFNSTDFGSIVVSTYAAAAS